MIRIDLKQFNPVLNIQTGSFQLVTDGKWSAFVCKEGHWALGTLNQLNTTIYPWEIVTVITRTDVRAVINAIFHFSAPEYVDTFRSHYKNPPFKRPILILGCFDSKFISRN